MPPLSSFDRRRQRVTMLGSGAIWIGYPMVLFIWPNSWPLWLFGFILSAAFAGTQLFCRRLIARIDSEEEAVVGTLAREIRAGSDNPFVLYLRPFWSDAVIRRTRIHSNDPIDPASIYNQAGDVHTAAILTRLAARLEKVLIKLGQPSPALATRAGADLELDDPWFAEFTALASRATAVFLVPGGTPSTFREICWLKDNRRLSRVFVLMPPLWMLRESRDAWESALERLRSAELEFPAENGFCGVFRWNDDGSIAVSQPVVAWGPLWISVALARVTGDTRWFEYPLWMKLLAFPLWFTAMTLLRWVGGAFLITQSWWLRNRDLPIPLRVIFLPIGVTIAVAASLLYIGRPLRLIERLRG